MVIYTAIRVIVSLVFAELPKSEAANKESTEAAAPQSSTLQPAAVGKRTRSRSLPAVEVSWYSLSTRVY